MKKISILVPVYNESESLKYLYDELVLITNALNIYAWEFLFVNDGSTDNSLIELNLLREKDLRINILDLSRNFGKEVAMLAGFDYVSGDALIILDADLQDPPSLFPEMIQYWENGFDDVYAKRRTRSGEDPLKKITSKFFYRVLQKMANVSIQTDTGDFRLLDRKCVDALKQLRESQRYTKGMFSWIGYNKKEVLFDRAPRIAGETKWNYWKLFNLAIEGITSFSTAPLRIASLLGVIISFVSFVFMIMKFFKALLYGDPVQGYPSLLIIILFLGGIQMLFLGIIGEYIGRIFHETKKRPVYFVKSYNNK